MVSVFFVPSLPTLGSYIYVQGLVENRILSLFNVVHTLCTSLDP